MNDLEFVQNCIKGDKHSWEEFITKYTRLIYNYIRSVLLAKGHEFSQHDINDIFQELLTGLVRDNYKKLKSFKAKNGCSLASWLRQLAVNSTLDYLRKLKPAISLNENNEDDLSPLNTVTSGLPLVADALGEAERIEQLKDCIEKLEFEEKYFLELHINRDISIDDLKDHLKVSRGLLDMRKSRIIEKLKNCFKRKGFLLDL